MKNDDLRKLLKNLTVKEKVGQLVQLTADHFDTKAEITGPYAKYKLSDDQKNCVGSIIGPGNAKSAYEIQKNI